MEMYVEICGGSKTLYEGDSTGLRLGAFQARLFGQKGRDGAVDHLQDRREQLGVRRDRLSSGQTQHAERPDKDVRTGPKHHGRLGATLYKKVTTSLLYQYEGEME